jgi:hypothetical protein
MCGGAAVVLQAYALAQQGSWTPEFAMPGGGAKAQTSPLKIRVAGIPEDVPQRLAVEIDDIDVTPLAVLDGVDIVVTPAQPLAFGPHRLRLVEYARDGSIAERGHWSFDIRKSAAFREAQFQANVTLNATDRVADHNVNAAPGKVQGNGAAQLQGAVADEAWKGNASMSVVGNSRSGQMPRREGHVDIGQYLLAAQSGAVAGRMGDHAIGPDSLVMQRFARRGISTDLAGGGVARITGFSMHTTPIAGSQDLSGVGDSHNRVDGVMAMVNPFVGRPDDLAVSGTYVNGEGTTLNGAGVAGSNQAFGGRAGGVVADANLFDRLLRLRGEYAHSAFDFDGAGTGLDAQSGHAYSGLANYLPWRALMVLDQPLVWNIGGERKVLSTFFRSPANPGAVSDRDRTQAFTGLNWYGLNMQAAASREHDNVDDVPLLPRTDSVQRSASLNYAPFRPAVQSPAGAASFPWYGQPNLTASYMSLKKDLSSNPGALPLSTGPLHETKNLMLGAQFQYARANWGVTHSRVADRDFSGLLPDTRTVSDRIQAGFQVSKLNVGTSLQHDQTDDLTRDARSQAVIGGTTLAYPFTDRVTSNLAFTVRHAWAPQTPADQIVSDTTLGLNWVAVPAKGIQPGLALGMDGSYHRCRDKTAAPALGSTQPIAVCLDSYQLFLKMSVSWMPAY